MRWRTHRSIGVLIYSLLILMEFSIANVIPSLIGVFICAEISIIPDRIEKPLKLKHRGPTHSFLAFAIIVFSTVIHLIADSFTDKGIPLLWPNQNRFQILQLWSYNSGKTLEENLSLALNAMTIALWIINFWQIFRYL